MIGRRYRCGTWAAAGNSETVMKTAHPLTAKRHEARLAVSARHISDLADADRNFFVLLGGQDARPGSTTRLDQIGLWREGRYLQVPLRPETARRDFRLHVEILP